MKSAALPGSPDVSQRASGFEAHKPCCVLVVDRSGVRFFRYWLGKMSELEKQDLHINISQWKKKDLGHVATPGIKKTRGSQRDTFDLRMDAQYPPVWKEVAKRAKKLCAIEGLATIFLVGSDRLTKPLKRAFPRQLQNHIELIRKDLGGFSTPALGRRLEPRIAKLTAISLQR